MMTVAVQTPVPTIPTDKTTRNTVADATNKDKQARKQIAQDSLAKL